MLLKYTKDKMRKEREQSTVIKKKCHFISGERKLTTTLIMAFIFI